MINCFPYKKYFSVSKFDNVVFNINLIILKQPSIELVDESIYPKNITLYTSINGHLSLNEYFNSFGNYTLQCNATIFIFENNYTFSKIKTVEITGW